MSGKELWFRVPKWCVLADDPSEGMAALWLLGRWDLGQEPSIAKLKAATGWGWDRAAKFAAKLWEWAGEAGAERPAEKPVSDVHGKSGRNRGGGAGKSGSPDVEQTPVIEEERGGLGEAPGRNRGASRAPSFLSKTDRDQQIEAREPDPVIEAPPPKPPPRPALPPSPADRPPPPPVHTTDGREAPADLFLFRLRPLDAGIIAEYCDSPAELLMRTPAEIGRWKGLGPPGAERIAKACERAGFPLGCVPRSLRLLALDVEPEPRARGAPPGPAPPAAPAPPPIPRFAPQQPGENGFEYATRKRRDLREEREEMNGNRT